MKTFLFLLVVCAFCLNCGGGAPAANNANKPATNANANANANKPASTPASSNSDAKTDNKGSNDELDFTLVNKTGYDIKQVSVGPTGDTDWKPEDEVLKGRAFKNGDSLDIKFNPKAKAENWDLKIEWTDGSPSVEWLKFNLTKIEKITLKYDKATDKTTAETAP